MGAKLLTIGLPGGRPQKKRKKENTTRQTIPAASSALPICQRENYEHGSKVDSKSSNPHKNQCRNRGCNRRQIPCTLGSIFRKIKECVGICSLCSRLGFLERLKIKECTNELPNVFRTALDEVSPIKSRVRSQVFFHLSCPQ